MACKKWTSRRWTRPRMLISATPPPKRNNPLWHKQGGTMGRPGLGANSTGGGLQRVTARSQLSSQAPAVSPGPEHSCVAKDLNPTPELPHGRAMHSNAGEKSDRVGPEPPGRAGLRSTQLERQSEEFNLLPSSLLRALGSRAPGQAPARGRVTIPRTTRCNLETHCPDNANSPQAPRHLEGPS